MGMYARINAQLEDANKRKGELEAGLKTETDEKVIDEATYELADVYQSIGELEGALAEMAETDGYGPDDYGEWLDTFKEE